MLKKIEYSSYFTDEPVLGHVVANVRREGSKTLYVISRRAYNRAYNRANKHVIVKTSPRFHLSGENEYIVIKTKYGYV